MKNILILILSIVVFASCEDDLNQVPISYPSAASFYENTDDFEQALNGAYSSLDYYAGAHFYLSEIRSDNVYSPGTGTRVWNAPNNFEKTLATNSFIGDTWDAIFEGIFRVNIVLDKINETAVPDNNVRDRMIGESKFLRALYYFDLVKFYGGVPLIDHVLTPEELLSTPRATVSEVYNKIVEDLEESIQLLPSSGSEEGRASSVIAKALLAKVYLTRSGPTYGIEGPGLGVEEKAKALTLLNEVIGSGQFGWVPDYASIFDYNNESNGDIVFAKQNINDGSTGDRGTGTNLPSLMYNELWADGNLPFSGGVPPDSPILPSNQFMGSFEPSDLRDDFSILLNYVDGNGNTINTPQIIKFLSLNHVPGDQFNWAIDFPIIRYTDVLLMKAEILIQNGGAQSEIDDIVNMVRDRAGLAPVTNVNLDMLLEERRKEFFGEGLRWDDLVRTGKVLDVMNAWELIDDSANKISGLDANDIIYPIHQDQLDVKEGLYHQNPGY